VFGLTVSIRGKIMKRVLTIALAMLAIAVPAFANQYGWTISSSSTSPFQNVGGLAPGEVDSLYLWYQCSDLQGMSASEFVFQVNGGITLMGFHPLSGFIMGGVTTLILAIAGCPRGPLLAGSIRVMWQGSAASVCIVPDAQEVRATVDCTLPIPQMWPIHAYGWADSGTPCNDGFPVDQLCLPPVSVSPQRWGSVKAVYR
jgi:hypothetical protein